MKALKHHRPVDLAALANKSRNSPNHSGSSLSFHYTAETLNTKFTAYQEVSQASFFSVRLKTSKKWRSFGTQHLATHVQLPARHGQAPGGSPGKPLIPRPQEAKALTFRGQSVRHSCPSLAPSVAVVKPGLVAEPSEALLWYGLHKYKREPFGKCVHAAPQWKKSLAAWKEMQKRANWLGLVILKVFSKINESTIL